MKTDQDFLRELRAEGDAKNAARFLRQWIENDRHRRRWTPTKTQPKKPRPSGDWQITRSHALRALREGAGLDDFALLELHLRLAFKQEKVGETIEERQARAVETFEACLDAAKAMMEPEEDLRNHFRLVDDAAAYALEVMEQEQRFPPYDEIQKAASNSTGLRCDHKSEWTKILRDARLSFLCDR